MTIQRVTLIESASGRRVTKFYTEDEYNEMWGFCAKMVFLVPFIYSSVTIETVDEETRKAYIRSRDEREQAIDRARVAWDSYVKREAGEVV
jgi:hypothetical protein